ncbi:AMP-binding protein [Nocardioides alcanivorans]|uniref:AMP-binding protein n=1 Tax=Nocardioides alcanivorans TaxID=2897352 RepID=UPI001F2D25D9|nr:AMP-binding protein [Nocardioides alcanivorans]
MTTLPLGLIPQLHAQAAPDRPAVRCGPDSMTRREFADAVGLAAAHLVDVGAHAGSTVAIALPNGPDFLIAAFAAWRIDATPLPLSSVLPAAERDALLDLAAPAVVISDTETGWPTVPPSALRSDRAGLPALPTPAGDRPWKLIGSGGSTGRPKLILAGTPASADPAAERYTIRGDDVVLVPGPLYHQGPFIFSTAGLITGASVVLMPRFDPQEALDLVAGHSISWTFMVPTMTHRIWRQGEEARSRADLSSLRLLFSTGAPWPSWLKSEWMSWLGPERVLEWYGGTEEQGACASPGRKQSTIPEPSAAPTTTSGSCPQRAGLLRRSRSANWSSGAEPPVVTPTWVRRTATRRGAATAISPTSTKPATCTSSTVAPI